MAFKFENPTNVTAMSIQDISAQDVSTLISSINITPEMVERVGSERSAKFAAVTASISSKGRDTDYFKARLYADWKSGYKAEKNTLYKSVSEIAQNAGESRQAFDALAKVGAKFFPSDETASAVAKKWTDKRYPWAALFDLTALPYDILDKVDALLSVAWESTKDNLSGTICRRIKEAFAASGKDVNRFTEVFIEHKDGEQTLIYSPEDFKARICNYKLYLSDDKDDDKDDDKADDKDDDKADDENHAEKSGYIGVTVLHSKYVNTYAIFPDGEESAAINYLADNGYKIISTSYENGVSSRVFVKYADTYLVDMLVLRVKPISMDDLKKDVELFNFSKRLEMKEKGIAQYFHPYSTAEYVDAVTCVTFPDLANIDEKPIDENPIDE